MSRRSASNGRNAGGPTADDWDDWGPRQQQTSNRSNSAPSRQPIMVGRPAGMSDDEDSDYDDDIYCNNVVLTKDRPPYTTTGPVAGQGSFNSSFGKQVEKNLSEAEQLRLACVEGDVETVQKLLDGGQVKVDECFQNGWSPLMIAMSYAKLPLMQLLLERGADVNYRASSGSGEGLTPLMVASLPNGDLIEDAMKCATLLLEKGADVNLANMRGLTPLMCAVKDDKLPLVEEFLKAGAEVNAVDFDGRSALELAATNGRGRIIRVLLQHDADANLVNEFGQTPGDVACDRGHQKISDILFQVTSTKWRPGLNPQLINEMADVDTKRFAFPNKAADLLECNERSQIEMVLENLQLQELYKKFQAHKVSYLNFLNLNESQLKDIGIENVGERMKILDAIRDIHNREWVDKSVTPIYLKSDITASEVICILNNTKKHMEYITTTVKYLREKSMSNPEMLEVGIEQSPLTDMKTYAASSLAAISTLQEEIKLYQRVLNQLEKHAEFQIPDAVPTLCKGSIGRTAVKWTSMLSAITLAGIGIVFALRYKTHSG